MAWFPWDAVEKGGPWAVLLLLALLFLLARARGIIASDKEVERTVDGYREVIAHQREELTYWRASCERKDETITAQNDQIRKLIDSSDLATQALRSLAREAERRGLDA